jgi:hypothetical protein
LTLSVNKIAHTAEGAKAVPLGYEEVIPTHFVLRSIGYLGCSPCSQDELPFSKKDNCVPNVNGAVLSSSLRNIFVSGWIKRGPTGVIGTNKQDADETVEAIAASLKSLSFSSQSCPDLRRVLMGRRGAQDLPILEWSDVSRILEAEKRQQYKIESVDEMIERAKASTSSYQSTT